MSNFRDLSQNTKSWNLNDDSQCFGLVENFAQNFLNRIDYYKSELMKTNYDLKESENDISHLFCKLGNLSNDHFIENSVKSIDFEKFREEKNENTLKKGNSSVEKINELFKLSLHNGYNLLNIPQSVASAAKEDELNKMESRLDSLSIANFSYMSEKSKGLPFLYGTRQFFANEGIGLVEINSPKEKEFGTLSQEEKKLIQSENLETNQVKNPERKETAISQSQNMTKIDNKTTDSQAAFIQGSQQLNEKKMPNVPQNLPPPIQNMPAPPPLNLPPPPPPPDLKILLTQPVKPLPTVLNENPKTTENTTNNENIKVEKKNEAQPLDLMGEILKKRMEMMNKKDGKTTETVKNDKPEPRILETKIEVSQQISEKKIEDVTKNVVNEQNVEVPERYSGNFQSGSHKTSLNVINKHRLNIKETNNLFVNEDDNNEEEDEDALFKNTNKKSLTTLFKAVEVSPKKESPSIIQERPFQDEESPAKILTRPSLRKQDFDLMENKEDAGSNENPKLGTDKMKNLFMDSDEENPSEMQQSNIKNKLETNVLRNMRKSYSIKQKNEDHESKELSHDLMMDKPIIRNKKKGPPTFFRDDEGEEEEKKEVIIPEKEKKFPPKLSEDKGDDHYNMIFHNEKIEEQKDFMLQMNNNRTSSHKLGKLFDDEENEEEDFLFNKPTKFVTNQKKNALFDDDEDDN